MSVFWFWFLRPLAELLFGLSLLAIILVAVVAYVAYREGTARRHS